MNCFLKTAIVRGLSRVFVLIALIAGCVGLAGAADAIPPTGGNMITGPQGAAMAVPGTSKSEVKRPDQRSIGKDMPMSHAIKGDGISLPGCVADGEKGIACK